MKLHYCIAAFIGSASFLSPSSGVGAAGQTSEEKRLAIAIEQAVQAEVPHGFSGVVLVARGGKSILENAYGAERGTPMKINSRFWIASGGKQFTSAAIRAPT